MNKIIKLNNLLNLTNEELKNTKIRLMVSSNDCGDPHQDYINDPNQVTEFKFLWEQEKQGAIFKEGQLGIGLLRIAQDRWLLVTAQKILKRLGKDEAGVNYQTEIIDNLEKYFGRIIVRFKNKTQQMCRNAETIMDDLEVGEILPARYEGEIFPGYENVTLPWYKLKAIIDNQKQDWITALKNQKGVYLITDNKTGKLYVGSAYGDNMLLQRWSNYISTGHGGNKGLEELAFEYIKENFQYSILETHNNTISDKTIINRERWWIKTLKSVDFGYNKN